MKTTNSIPGYDRIAATVALMQAYLDGKTIEYKNLDGEWIRAGSDASAPTFAPGSEYRVKPEETDFIDWSHVSPQLKYMARDENGEIWLYRYMPEEGDGAFVGQRGIIRANAFASLKVSSVGWKESVVKRPEGV